jgi:transcription-repair coupling factor (superfamily II helicase)
LRAVLGEIPNVENFAAISTKSLHAIAITSAPLERGLVLLRQQL